MTIYVIMPLRTRPRSAVAEVFSSGTRDVIWRFDDENAALACRRELQRGADKAALLLPPEPVTKPAATRERHAGRWIDAPPQVLIAASLAWAGPAAAQHSALYECLQQAPGGTAEQMLTGCQEQVREWMSDCERMRNADVCVGAIHEEAALASAQRRQPWIRLV